MYLQRLTLANFKNYEALNLQFSAGMILISGKNGCGKTNLLDAVHLLCLGKSYFTSQDLNCVKHEQNFYRVEGDFMLNEQAENICATFETGAKKEISRNRVFYPRLSHHVGKFPAVMIAPDDINIINEGSEERRRLIDLTLSQLNHSYLDELMSYNKVLAERNAALKKFAENNFFDNILIDAFDAQLVKYGNEIYWKRKKIFEKWIEPLTFFYKEISGRREVPEMIYESSLHEISFSDLLKQNREKDKYAARTTDGIHRDDLNLLLNGTAVKKFGSQGQKKTFLLALKLSQYQLIAQQLDLLPVLLLDDVFDKLDEHRVKKLVEIVSAENFGQVLITDTQEERMKVCLQHTKSTFASASAYKEISFVNVEELISKQLNYVVGFQPTTQTTN